jgi:hypothetical protein
MYDWLYVKKGTSTILLILTINSILKVEKKSPIL